MAVFIIGEAGSNWKRKKPEEGLEAAYDLIDAGAQAGVDAIKFQVFRGVTTYAAGSGACDHLTDKGIPEDIREVFKKLEMNYAMIPELAARCEMRGVEFMASYFSAADFAAVDPYVKRHKIASPELHDIRILEMAAKSGKPTILSTGMCTPEEIEWAIGMYEKAGGKELTLLQCQVAYPAPPEDVNLRVLKTLRESFGKPVGLSDHTLDATVAPIGAVALGATVIEKHYTISRELVGPDHSWAIEPHELRELVRTVRLAEKMRGEPEKCVTPSEESLLFFSKRGIHATRRIERGEALQEGVNIAILRSGKQKQGIHSRHLCLIEGKPASGAIEKGQGIQSGDWDETGDGEGTGGEQREECGC